MHNACDAGEKVGRPDPTQWLNRYGDALYQYAYARLGHSAQAEDAVQECLLAALKARQRYRADSSEKTWLFGILKHKVLDQFRRNAREMAVEDESPTGALLERSFDSNGTWREPPERWSDPAGELERAQFWSILEHCMGALPKTLGMTIRLVEIDNTPSEEVCKALGISATNLWVRLHRARLGLRNCIQQFWFAKRTSGSSQQ